MTVFRSCGAGLLLWLLLTHLATAADNSLNASFRPVAGAPAAQDFTLLDRSGTSIQLSSLLGHVVMVNFWATWCRPCRVELPIMRSTWERFADQPFELLAINAGEDLAIVNHFLTNIEPAIQFPVLLDPTMRVIREWQVLGVPTTYLIDRAGRMVYSAQGGLDFGSNDVLAKIRELVREAVEFGVNDRGAADNS